MDDPLSFSAGKGGRFVRMGSRLLRSVSHYPFFGNYLDVINPQQHVLAARTVANIIRTSFGQEVLPFHSKHKRETQTYRVGLYKILISPDGKTTVTNDRATILSQVGVEYQIARLLL